MQMRAMQVRAGFTLPDILVGRDNIFYLSFFDGKEGLPASCIVRKSWNTERGTEGDAVLDRSERELLHLCRRDPEKGVSRMIDEYHGAVQSVCSHILQGYGSCNVEDAVQESFIRMWKFFREGPKIKKSVRAYVYQIARNCALDQIRKQKSCADMSLDAMPYEGVEELAGQASANLEDEFARKHNFQLIHEAIRVMEEPDRSLFLLKYFYGYTVRQAAEKVGLAEDNAESRIRRERVKLQGVLREHGM